jgi:glycosyltransferase involved in cell wall biosynthesis
MKILTFSTLFPNADQPSHGIFVENRLRHLLGSGEVEASVVAPVAWFPSAAQRFGDYARLARVAAHETRHGISIVHPRFLSIPKIGMHVAPLLLYHGALRAIRRLIADGLSFDLIDAHYYYPDGIAAALLGRTLGKPVVITARGTDVNLIGDFALPRRMILWAAKNAAASITVCAALKTRLVELGAEARKIQVLRNGVDLAHFRPRDRATARQKYGTAGASPLFLSVGHLIERKAHHLVIEALPHHPTAHLLIAGEGPERATLEVLAGRLGVADRVRLLGRVTQSDLPDLYSAADVLVLASSREGWANVLLEAMACGTPVAASNVWGAPEVVAEPAAGVLVDERSGAAFADGIARVLSAALPREATRRYAEGFSWDATTAGQLELFREVLALPPAAQAQRLPEARLPATCEVRNPTV